MIMLVNTDCFYSGSHLMCKAFTEDLFTLLFSSLLQQHSWRDVQTLPRKALPSPRVLCSPRCSPSLTEAEGRVRASACSAQVPCALQTRNNLGRICLLGWVGPCHAGQHHCFKPLVNVRWGQDLLTTSTQMGMGTTLCFPLTKRDWWWRERGNTAGR